MHFRIDGQRQQAAIFAPDGGAPQSIALDVATAKGRDAFLKLLADLRIRSLEIAEPNRIPGACLAHLTQHFAYELLITDTGLAARAAIGSGLHPDWTGLVERARGVIAIGEDGAAFAVSVLGLQVVRPSDPPARPVRNPAVDGPVRIGLLALHGSAVEFRFARALSDQVVNADADVEIIVLATTLDDLKLMQRTNVRVTGEIAVDDVATLIEGHGITKLVLDIGEPAFGHPPAASAAGALQNTTMIPSINIVGCVLAGEADPIAIEDCFEWARRFGAQVVSQDDGKAVFVQFEAAAALLVLTGCRAALARKPPLLRFGYASAVKEAVAGGPPRSLCYSPRSPQRMFRPFRPLPRRTGGVTAGAAGAGPRLPGALEDA